MRRFSYGLVSLLLLVFFTAPAYLWRTPPTAPAGKTIATRFAPPAGYQRVAVGAGSYREWLRGLPLQSAGAPIHLYNGRLNGRQDAHAAVVDLDVGTRDLQQCADTIMRLRAEYLYARKDYAAIHFNFTNGFRADFAKWVQGYRIAVRGNRVSWVRRGRPDRSHASLRAYLDVVFTYAGTASLSKELQRVPVAQMRIGDVFIHGGFPGHASMVVDMAVHPRTGQKVFLLAEGFMPAQEAYLPKNPADAGMSPWFPLAFGAMLTTSTWTFGSGELKRFR